MLDFKKYLPENHGRLDFLAMDNATLANKLKAQRPSGIQKLQTSLSQSAHSAVEEIEEALEFIVQDNPGNMDVDRVLKNVQWHLDFTRVLEEQNLEGTWIDPVHQKEIEKLRLQFEAKWRQRFKVLPTKNWHARADKIGQEKDPLTALALYNSLRNDMAYMEEAIGDSANALDAWIQMEVDRYRGK